MNARYYKCQQCQRTAAEQVAADHFHENPSTRKAPYRIYPIMSTGHQIEAENENKSQKETPRLPEPEELMVFDNTSSIPTAGSDYLTESVATSGSEGQFEDNPPKTARTRFKLRFNHQTAQVRSASTNSSYVQTEPSSYAKPSTLTPSKAPVTGFNRTQEICRGTDSMSLVSNKPFEVLNSNNRHMNRFAYNSYQGSDIHTLCCEPETSNQGKVRRYAPIRPFSSSPKASGQRRGHFQTSITDSRLESSMSSQSLHGKIVKTFRDPFTSERKMSLIGRDSGSYSLTYRAKVEAFFWDPAELRVKKTDSISSENRTQFREYSSFFPEDTFSGRGEIFHEAQSECAEITGPPNLEQIENNVCKKLELSFTKPMNQVNVVSERNLASYFNSPVQGANRELPEKPLQLEARKLQEISNRPRVSEKNDTQDTTFKKKNSAAVTDTVQSSITQMKRIRSPNSYKSRARARSTKEAKKSEEPEPDWSAQTTESGPDGDFVNVVRARDMSPNLAKKSLPTSARDGPVHSARQQITAVFHKGESELEVSPVNESMNSSSIQSSECDVNSHCEEYSESESDERSQSSREAYGTGNQNKKADSNCKKNHLQFVNEELRLMEKKMIKLIERLYNQENAENRSEQEQAFVETVSEAAIRTAHLKLNNKNLTLLEKDVGHLNDILERIQKQVQQRSFTTGQGQKSNLSVSFVENLAKVVGVAKEKRDLLKNMSQAQKVPIEPKVQSSRADSSHVPMTRSRSLKQLPINASSQNPLSILADTERLDSARKPHVLEKKSSLEVFKTNESLNSERYDTNVVSCMLTTRREEGPMRIIRLPLGRLQCNNNSSNKLTDRARLGSNRGPEINGQEYEEFRAGFIQLALNIKAEFDANHPCHKILISDLLEEAFKGSVSKENWRGFIQQKYLKSK